MMLSADERAASVVLDTTLVVRFWAKVQKTEACWLWKGSTTRGYGTIASTRKNRPLYAHRVSFALHAPAVDLDGHLVLHKCDNRKCVRPDHLFLGTTADNAQDAWHKGRLPLPKNAPFGETHHCAKLTQHDVKEIRTRLLAGDKGVVLADRFGVSKSTISLIRRGKKWKSV